MNKLRTVILDDEHFSTETLGYFLSNNCSQVELVGSFNEPLLALDFLMNNEIDLLILDIEMPHLNGFELLQKLRPFSFELIFFTAYNDFALKAFRYSAFDYFLKPLDEEELLASIERLASKHKIIQNDERLDFLLEMMRPASHQVEKIALPTLEGYEFIQLKTIIRFEADSNYVKIFMKDKKPMVVCKTLKEMEESLKENAFIRVHNSHLVNVNFVEKYLKKEGGVLLTADGAELPVSRMRKDYTLSRLNIS